MPRGIVQIAFVTWNILVRAAMPVLIHEIDILPEVCKTRISRVTHRIKFSVFFQTNALYFSLINVFPSYFLCVQYFFSLFFISQYLYSASLWRHRYNNNNYDNYYILLIHGISLSTHNVAILLETIKNQYLILCAICTVMLRQSGGCFAQDE